MIGLLPKRCYVRFVANFAQMIANKTLGSSYCSRRRACYSCYVALAAYISGPSQAKPSQVEPGSRRCLPGARRRLVLSGAALRVASRGRNSNVGINNSKHVRQSSYLVLFM